jgi:anthranilate synthase/aminodeoxychorismate synthase-like glutamine amidotransferase
MILLIDNYDSFTYNLYQQIERLGGKVKVVKNDEVTVDDIKKMNPSAIVISPGPGRPEDAGISLEVINYFYKKLPILGVCLGHQAIGLNFGVKVVGAKKILHGKTALVAHGKKRLFKRVENPFLAARYHSLVIDEVPCDFELSAWTDDCEIMGIHHKELPVFGIQFHPESFMTEHGDKIIKNFLDVSKSY